MNLTIVTYAVIGFSSGHGDLAALAEMEKLENLLVAAQIRKGSSGSGTHAESAFVLLPLIP